MSLGCRRSARLLLAALATLILMPSSVAGAQATPAGASTGVVTCATPPAGVTTSPQDRDRFVGLWSPRVNDAAFLQAFIDAPAVPDAIVAEGFHRLDPLTQGWLVICLVERLTATGAVPPGTDVQKLPASLGLVVFGKDSLNRLRADALRTTPVSDPSPPPVQSALTAATQKLSTTPVPLPPDTSTLVPRPPDLQQVNDLTGRTTQTLTDLLAGNPQTVAVQAGADVQAEIATPVAPLNVGALVSTGLNGTIAFPVLGRLVQVVETLLQNVVSIPGNLLAKPPLNLLGGATYKVCRESADLALACTLPVPVGVPVPVGLTADLVPDVVAQLSPQPSLFAPQDVTAGFSVTRLATAPPGPLPFHVFAVYDPPLTGRRIEFGFDGRPSTIADKTNGSVTVKNVFSPTLATDLNVQLTITHDKPGAVEAATVAVKTLVSQGNSQAPKEEDPLAGAVQFTPVPTSLTGDVRMRRLPGSEQTTITVTSSVPTLVEAQINRDVTSLAPKSHQEIRALVDKLPTKATVDLIRQGAKVNVHYFANSVIDRVSVSDKSVPDTSKPATYGQMGASVFGVPTDVNVTLTGGTDVLYAANGSVPKVQVAMSSFADTVLQNAILGQVDEVPRHIHLNLATGGDTTAGTYDADASLGRAQVAMYDKASDEQTLLASATSFPTHIGFSMTKSTGVLDYSSNGPITTIEARLTRAGGGTLSLAGDHATVLKQGTKVGADFVLSGLQAFRVEPNGKAKFSLTLNPGGQAFNALADLDDPNVEASVHISNLPSNITVTMDPATGSATYDASDVIDTVRAAFHERTKGLRGVAQLDGIPKKVNLSWNTGGDTPGLTYDASGKLGKIYGLYVEKPGGTSFEATIESLPEWFKVAGKDPYTFDARTGPAASSGSSSIGKMTFRYASDGTFATSPTGDDHAVLKTGSATKAELVYSGLRFISASTANKELHLELRNTEKRTFRAVLDSPDLLVQGVIVGVPDQVTVDLVGEKAVYATPSKVDQVAVDIDRRNGEKVAVDVTGIPASIVLAMSSAQANMDWSASDPTGSVGVVAKFGPPTLGGTRTVDSSLTLTGIPAHWKLSYAAGHPRFEGVSGPIGSIAAAFTNHGSATVLSGDHLSAGFDDATGDLDASIHISQLALADYQPLPNGFTADLKMGDGSPFGINARAELGGKHVALSGTMSNLPTDVHLESAGGRIRYNGNTNPTFQFSAAYGTPSGLAATPDPPSVHGLAVRDGADAIKANLSLTGLPKVLDFNPATGVYVVNGFAPTADLVIDAQLDNLVATPLSLLVVQAGIPSSGVDFTFGPTTTSTAADGTVKTHAGYVATKAMGKLTATASFGSDEAYFETSAVPKSLGVDLSFGPETKTVGVDLGSGITLLKALYRHTGDAAFAAGVELGDVPLWLDLTIGQQNDGQGVTAPVFSYHAEAAGLDLKAFAKATLFDDKLDARVDLTVTNFGKDVTAGLAGTTITVASNPATESFSLLASGRLKFNLDLKADEGPLHNTGSLAIDLKIFELTLGFTNLTSLTVKAGVSSAIEGAFGTFTLGERSNLKLMLTDKLVIDTGLGDFTLFDVGIQKDVGNVVGNFRLAGNHKGDWLGPENTFIPCRVQIDPPDIDTLHISVQLKPHPHSTTAGSSLTVSGPTAAEGNAHIVTVNPLGAIPDRVLDVIARFASPDGGDQGLSTTCPD